MSEKFNLTQKDIEILTRAIETLRSADFNAIHDDLEILSGINAQKQDIELKELYRGITALNNAIYDRGEQVRQAIESGDTSKPLNSYYRKLAGTGENGDYGVTGMMNNIVTRMFNSGVSSRSKGKINAAKLYTSV